MSPWPDLPAGHVPPWVWVLPAIAFMPPVAAADAGALYVQHCAECHGADRMGGSGPALLPENFERLKREDATRVIADGRLATQMPPFGAKLDAGEIAALVDLIYTPLTQPVQWTMADMESTRVVSHPIAGLPARPTHEADPLNLFFVVEAGDHHATILDGDRLEPIFRYPTRRALHGGPKFSPDGRFVYTASRDGWIAMFDLWSLKPVAEVRAGVNTRNLAVSGDGRFVMVANYLPHTLVVLDAADLRPLKVIAAVDDHGKSSRVSAVYDAAPRRSFIAALKDIKEIWEIPYTDGHEPIYDGMVHDYRYGEGIAEEGPFPVRRIRLDDYLDDFSFDPAYENVIGAARDGGWGQVVNLIVGRPIARVDLPGLPHLASGVTWVYRGRPVLATPNLKEGAITVIDLQDWTTVGRIETLGPGFFLRTHENTPYAWADVFSSARKDSVHVIDKQSLAIVKTLTPMPGRTAAHVEFTRDGRYALLSIWEQEGAIVVYDAQSLTEVKRIPMCKPVGKYNVHNKISRSPGTSH
jgi:mono/diheme cytochrome c family protein/WD40 repeat protein